MKYQLLETFDEFVNLKRHKKYEVGDRVTLYGGQTVIINEYNKFNDNYTALDEDNNEILIEQDEIEFGNYKLPSIFEEDITTEKDFKEYVYTVYKKAFGDKFDSDKADEVIDALVKKHKDDYATMIGVVKNSM